MDDSFKKLNGPSADSIQSDYIAKERRAAEELLTLQLGNAKKLADLRSRLLNKLMDEAREEGKLVEDYLAEYGLQKRLDALATELEAEKKARTDQLTELHELMQENSEALASTEEELEKRKAERLTKKTAAQKTALEAQHKAELAHIKDVEKIRKKAANTAVPELNTQINVDASALEAVEFEATELEVAPNIAEIILPETELPVKAKVEFDPAIPTEAEIATKVIPEIPEADLTLTPVIKELPELLTEVQLAPNVLPIDTLDPIELAITPVTEPIEVEATVTTRAEDLSNLTAQAILTPDLTNLQNLEVSVKANVEQDTSSSIVDTIPTDADTGIEATAVASRLDGIKQTKAQEADLVDFRKKAEADLVTRRVSSLDALRDKLTDLLTLASTGATGGLPTDELDSFAEGLEESLGLVEDIDLSKAVTDSIEKVEKAKTSFDSIKKRLTEAFSSDTTKGLHESLDFLFSKTENNIEAIRKNISLSDEAKRKAILKEYQQAEAQAQNLYNKKQHLNKLLKTNADESKLKAQIEEERQQKQLDSLLDREIKLATKKQELLRANLEKIDEEALREEILAETRAAALDEEIRAANEEKEKLKQKIKLEESYVQIRLNALKNNKDLQVPEQYKGLVTDPEALKSELVKQMKELASTDSNIKTQLENQGLTEADRSSEDFYDEGIAAAKKKAVDDARDKAVEDAKAKAVARGENPDNIDVEAVRASVNAKEVESLVDIDAVKAQIDEEFNYRQTQALILLAAEQDGVKDLYRLYQEQEHAREEGQAEARKRAAKEEEAERKKTEAKDEKGFKAWSKRFLELNKGKGKIGEAITKGADLANSLSKGGMKDHYAELLAENGGDEAKAKAALQEQTQAKLDAAFDAVGNFLNQLQEKGQASTAHQTGVDTRLQGLTTNESEGGIKKFAGSYWRSLSADIGKLGVSPFFLQEEAEKRFANLIGQGIAFNVKERAFLDVLKDKIATTFNVADGTLLKLVRIQQADTSAARLGMESALTEFLNSMYATTEYMQQAAESIRSNLYEATALMEAREATELEFQIQKWMGSLYSVGFSNTEGLSASLGKMIAGEIEGITEGGFGNLLIMAANEAGKSVTEILDNGLSATDADDLMASMVEYLAKIYKETHGSNVLAQQIANVYGLTASDLKAAASLAPSLKEITGHDETFSSMLKQVEDMANTMIARTSTGEMMENMKANFMYSMASSLANDPVSSSLHLVANLLNDLVGGIEIPFINVWGYGFELNASIADLMNVAALAGPILGGVGKMIAGLSNLNPSNLLRTFGIEQGANGLDVMTRGTTSALVGGTLSGKTESESGYVGNEDGNAVKDKTISDASQEPESTIAEAKEENEDKEDARTQLIASHIVDIYELLQEVTLGSKKFHVQVDVGGSCNGSSLVWGNGTWN